MKKRKTDVTPLRIAYIGGGSRGWAHILMKDLLQCAAFSGEVRLPVMARQWGDCELVIRDDEREVFWARLNAQSPAATIGINVGGSVLTIEIRQGSAGPIQNHVVLHRGMLLVERPEPS